MDKKDKDFEQEETTEEAQTPEVEVVEDDQARDAGELSREELQQLLQAKEEEAKANEEKFLRQAAELENYKKRVARDKEDAIRFANEALIRDLLPILDNLERAVEHARGGGDGKPLLEGIEMVLQTWLDALGKHGVTQVQAKGEPFDPEKHEAYAQVETEEVPPNTVVDEVHRGYFLRDRLLRPSLVSVAKPPGNKETQD